MAVTIAALKEAGGSDQIKIVAGGAPVTQDFIKKNWCGCIRCRDRCCIRLSTSARSIGPDVLTERDLYAVQHQFIWIACLS